MHFLLPRFEAFYLSAEGQETHETAHETRETKEKANELHSAGTSTKGGGDSL